VRIGLLSDTHNNVENLEQALNHLRQEDVNILIHCGDFTDPDLVRLLYGFRVIAVFGNGDYASGQIRQNLLELNPTNFAGLVYTGELGGARIAISHGHLPGKISELVRSDEYDFVFTGHSHIHMDATYGSTRLVNPGSLGGKRSEARQFCMVDLASRAVQFIEI